MDTPRCEDILNNIVETITDGVYFIDSDRRITFWNKGAERITGYSRSEVVGKRCGDGIIQRPGSESCEICVKGCPLASARAGGEKSEAEVFLHHKDGHRVPVLVRANPMFGPGNKPIGFIEIFSDRSERSNLLSELETLRKEVLTDQMTGLGNRRFAEIGAAASFQELQDQGSSFGILMLDIDHFKAVNDEFGHTVGDRVLRMVGWTLANAVRRNDAAARWGGEEFLVICPRIGQDVLAVVAERVRALIEKSRIGLENGGRVSVTVSVGGAIARVGDDMESLVARADERLYACKAAGRNRALVGD